MCASPKQVFKLLNEEKINLISVADNKLQWGMQLTPPFTTSYGQRFEANL